MSDNKVKVKKVLFFDSGVGGLSVFNAVKKFNPEICPYYVFDHECFPYGTKTDEFIIERVLKIIKKCIEETPMDVIVVACNTASTVVLPALRDYVNIPVVGVVPAIKPAARLSKNKVLGLLATPATINREYTKNLIRDFAKDCTVISVGDPDLATLAEEKLITGKTDSAKIREILTVFTSKKEANPDILILGCTHYPFIQDEISSILPNVKIIDSGEAIARRVRTILRDIAYRYERIEEPKVLYTGILDDYENRFMIFKKFGFNKIEKIVV